MPLVNDPVNSLPSQVFLFTGDEQFILYKNLRSEFFEHLPAIINESGLKVLQYPTGNDLRALSKNELNKPQINI